ncbi:MAG: LytTR family transcriptional regulator DNA-binding domain-containing protein [Bacteroidota bacterium]
MKVILIAPDDEAPASLAQELLSRGHDVEIRTKEKSPSLHYLKVQGVFRSVDPEEIYMISSERVYSSIHFADRTQVVVRQTLSSLQEHFGNGFYRLRRGLLLNTRYLREVGPDSILLHERRMPVSRKHRTQLLQHLGWLKDTLG